MQGCENRKDGANTALDTTFVDRPLDILPVIRAGSKKETNDVNR